MRTTIRIEQLKAAAENAHLEKAVEAVPGVESVEVDSGECQIIVEHANVPPNQLFAALVAAGYSRAELVE